MDTKLREALSAGQQLLQCKKIESARWECELLLAHVMGVKRYELYLNEIGFLTSKQKQAFDKLLQRRLEGEPLQYILGSWEFAGLNFQLDKRVLIPRWETEWLVDAILKAVKGRNSTLYILDLGTGSGAIAVSLAYYLPQSIITAVDIKEDALLAAEENAVRNGVAHRIKFLQGDMFSPLGLPNCQNKFDIIVSNPPYIPTEQIATLMKEVRDYEPATALDGGADGLDYYRQIAGEAWGYLNYEGFLAIEMGAGQSQSIQKIFLETGLPWQSIKIIKDPAGINRIAIIH